MKTWSKADTSPIQMLAVLRDCGVKGFYLGTWDTIEGITLSDDGSVMVTILHWEVKEGQYRTSFQRGGYKFRQFGADGRAKSADDTVLWMDHLTAPDVVNSRIKSEQEVADALEWEQMTYRVGTAKNPMDNYSRTLEGATTSAMTKYWGVEA